MASYLALSAIGHYRITSSTHRGKPLVIAIPESLPAGGPAAQSLSHTGEVADYLATQFGPYPSDAYGGGHGVDESAVVQPADHQVLAIGDER